MTATDATLSLAQSKQEGLSCNYSMATHSHPLWSRQAGHIKLFTDMILHDDQIVELKTLVLS
jgi:hypothetical protein